MTTTEESTFKFSAFAKQAKVEKAIHEARTIKEEIEGERRAHRAVEYETASEKMKAAVSKLRATEEKVFLERVKARLLDGKVTGVRPARDQMIYSLETMELHDASHGDARFQVTHVHQGTKHRGLWCQFPGTRKPEFIDACEFRANTPKGTEPDYLLDCGLIVERSEIIPGRV